MNRSRGARLGCALMLLGSVGSGLGASAWAAPLVVSLTFDDGVADDVEFAALLDARGLHGTFYVISGALDHRGYLTPAQVRALEASGHEIGGHTVSHRHLPTIPPDEVQREICNDRTALVSYGLHPRNFAYPFGEYTAAAERFAAGCGYESARIVGPIPDSQAPASEEVPPKDPYAVITPYSVEAVMSLPHIESWVTAAEASGGWLPIVFHHLCQPGTPCNQYGVSVDTFTGLLDWLKLRSKRGTVVKLVREVVGGTFRPLVALANPLLNPSLEGTGAVPDGWQRGDSGSHTATWTAITTGAHGGASAQQVEITDYTSGSVQLVPSQAGAAPPAIPGHHYQVSGWYRSSAQVRWVAYTRDQSGTWTWLTQSPPLPPVETWTEATWAPPVMPAGATGLSFGLSLSSLGSLTVDDFGLSDLDLAPPAAPAAAAADSPAARPGDPPTLASSALAKARPEEAHAAVKVAPPAKANHSGLLKNPSLELDEAPRDGVPDCWTRTGHGVNTAVWSTTSEAHSGAAAQRVDITAWTSGAQRLVPAQDSGACAPAGVPGHRYRVTGWFQSTGGPRWVAHSRDASGAWVWWAQGPVLAAASRWTQSTFETPALPPGATHLSFGLSLYGTGSLTVDDFTLTDLGP